MPPPLAPRAGLPVTPAAPGGPDTGRSPLGERHPASDGGDFTGLLALLAGIVTPPPAPPVVVAAGDDVPAPGSDAPAGSDAPQPDAPSLEALVSALAQQASGMSHPMTPDPDADRARAEGASGGPGRAQAPDRATAVARLVDRWDGPALLPVQPGDGEVPPPEGGNYSAADAAVVAARAMASEVLEVGSLARIGFSFTPKVARVPL